jgi:HEAT repeat protein
VSVVRALTCAHARDRIYAAATVRLLGGRPPKVEKLRRKNDVDGLVRALRYQDPVRDRDGVVVDLGVEVRKLATEALAGIAGDAATGGLLRALDDPEESVRISAVRGLRERGDAGAAEQLTSAVTNWTEPEYATARGEALEALASLRDPAAPRRLVAGLVTRGAELDPETDAEVLRRLTQAGGHDALAGTIEDLVARLREGTAGARERAMLVWLAPDSVDPLIRALGDEAGRREAIFALGAIHDSRAVEKLCSILLGEDEPSIRTAAAWALGEIKDPAAVESLLVATADSDYHVRSEASASFDKLGNAAIAVAMSALVRPALENGAGPRDAIEAPGEGETHDGAAATEAEGAAAAGPALGAGSAADAPTVVRPSPFAPARGRRPPVTQAGPMLRKLLGWRSGSQ